jgi:hypothetical protein
VSAADDAAPVSAAEAKTLFDPLASATALVLAVSGGPDSTALLLMAARWRQARKTGPRLLAVTIDHGLRRESAGEARAVARLAHALGVPHRIVRWTGKKPATGLQQSARDAPSILKLGMTPGEGPFHGELLDALNRYARLDTEEVRAIAFEIALLGRSGLDYASPEKKYSLKAIPDESFSGLQLMCLMHAGFKRLDPEVNTGMDLDEPFLQALELFNAREKSE